MLISPLVVGALASGLAWIHLLLSIFWLSGYFAFFALSVWLKSRRLSRHIRPVQAYLALSTVLGLLLAALAPELIPWAPLFIAPLAIGLYAAAHKQERALVSGLATLAGSALMTVVAYDAGQGNDFERAWMLAAVQFLYFAGTVFYVKTVIRERNNPGFKRLSVFYHAVSVLAVAVLIPWPESILVIIVFAVLFLRALIVPRFKVTPKQVGIGEFFSTVAVAVTSLMV